MEIKEAFDMFDTDKNGYIDTKEFLDAIALLGFSDDNRKVI